MHIIIRFIEHNYVGPYILLILFFLFRFLQRRSKFIARWTPTEKGRLILFCAGLVAITVPLREIWDLWRGNNGYLKSFTDAISWLCAMGIGSFGLIRFWRAK